MTTGSTTTNADREIVLERVYVAPRELVFDAWTDPEAVSQWFGPNGFTMTIHEMDVRVGGAWKFTFHGSDGTDYDNMIVYTEIKRPELLRYNHGTSDEPNQFAVIVTFARQGKGTKITLHSTFPTKESRDKHLDFGAIEGGKQTLARLAEYLAKK